MRTYDTQLALLRQIVRDGACRDAVETTICLWPLPWRYQLAADGIIEPTDVPCAFRIGTEGWRRLGGQRGRPTASNRLLCRPTSG